MKFNSLVARITLAFALPASGVLGAAQLNPGDLVVSELLANPAAVSDTVGEWLELYNATATSLDINGLVLRDNGSNSHTIAAPTALLIDPGAYLVLGRNGDSAANGGYIPDYVYQDFTLSNGSDSIVLEWNQQTIFELSYTSTDGFGESGVSMQLNSLEEMITASSYSPAEPLALFGAGDRGTPGFGSLGYNTTDEVSEVPLPAAGWLFVSSLGLVAGIKRRSRTDT
jgi:hypothetical protein